MSRHTHSNYDSFLVNLGCGCCTAVMSFYTEYSAKNEIKKQGIGPSVTIKDGAGEVFLDVDTRYMWHKATYSKEWKFIDMLKESAAPSAQHVYNDQYWCTD